MFQLIFSPYNEKQRSPKLFWTPLALQNIHSSKYITYSAENDTRLSK